MNARSLFTRLFSRAPASETPGGVLRRSGAGSTGQDFLPGTGSESDDLRQPVRPGRVCLPGGLRDRGAGGDGSVPVRGSRGGPRPDHGGQAAGVLRASPPPAQRFRVLGAARDVAAAARRVHARAGLRVPQRPQAAGPGDDARPRAVQAPGGRREAGRLALPRARPGRPDGVAGPAAGRSVV